MDRRSILSLAAVVLKLATAPGFRALGIPLDRAKNAKTFSGTIIKSAHWKVRMTHPAFSYVLNSRLEPLCPRDNRIMRYEASGLPSGTDNRPSYHCDFEGCSVRYDLTDGYFTLAGMPDHINPIEELGVNTLRCEKHGSWLYRRSDQEREWDIEWCCGVEGCDFCILTGSKGSWVRT